MLLSKHSLGNTHILDLRKHVNTRFIRNDFNKVTYPYKNILRFKYVDKQKIIQLPNHHNYPEFKIISNSSSEEMIYRSILFFIQHHQLPKQSEVLLEAFHMNPYSYNETEWFHEVNKKKALLCIQREQTQHSLFQIGSKKLSDTIEWDIFPGEMLLFETDTVQQRYRKIQFLNEYGFLDLLTMSAEIT